METIFAGMAVLILGGSMIYSFGLLAWTTVATIFGAGEPHHSNATEKKRYIGITEKSYDYDED